jgi:hypothetical protein
MRKAMLSLGDVMNAQEEAIDAALAASNAAVELISSLRNGQ